jgi:hypothetical protein
VYEERLAERRERMLARAEAMTARADARYAQARQMADAIPFGQPMMPDHYSYNRDRRYRDRIHAGFGRAFAEYKRAEELGQRAHGFGRHGISADDEGAPDKLRAKVEQLRSQRETMVRRNKLIRKHRAAGIDAQMAALIADGMTEERAHGLLHPQFAYYGQGYPSFTLSNLGANLRRYEQRLADIERARSLPVCEGTSNGDGVSWYEDRDANRVCVEFPGKPDAEVRTELKRAGFRWSPSLGRWQRQTSPEAVRRARLIVEGVRS